MELLISGLILAVISSFLLFFFLYRNLLSHQNKLAEKIEQVFVRKEVAVLPPEQIRVFADLPQKILETLQGSANATSGKLSEIIKFIQLRSAYDRLIPLGDIVDFIGIQFPAQGVDGAIHFIDVKSGKRAALSHDQRKFKKLLTDHPEVVKFVTAKTEIKADGVEE